MSEFVLLKNAKPSWQKDLVFLNAAIGKKLKCFPVARNILILFLLTEFTRWNLLKGWLWLKWRQHVLATEVRIPCPFLLCLFSYFFLLFVSPSFRPFQLWSFCCWLEAKNEVDFPTDRRNQLNFKLKNWSTEFRGTAPKKESRQLSGQMITCPEREMTSFVSKTWKWVNVPCVRKILMAC